MSGRHSGRANQGLRITALPKTLKLIFQLAPRQLNDEIALAKVEVKRKGKQLGVAGAFFGVAAVFAAFLLTGLIVAAIMGLATIMPAWLAALIVCAVFLIIALIGGLVGLRKFKQAMPLVPEDTIRGLKHDLGIAKEGSDFDPAVLDPNSPQAKAAKEAKEAAKAKEKTDKEAKAAAEAVDLPAPTEPELRRRLHQRREHLKGVRDELGEEIDVKPQAQALLALARHRLDNGKDKLREGTERAAEKLSSLSSSARSGENRGSLPGQLEARWKPLLALAASAAVLLALLRKLFKS
ncbi:phage holin family protein [Arthrobacter sp. KBS0703]|uniref:phage holin family protein n=1 Tax=Arthrobacter sp. KBS0703 TaxID=1955698 RepID=UPI0009900FCF|nr:phage holin family protein [Arthrobacter sp. KBS0703]TSE16401.1 phage holin family protein [Arthrobacter sp. KBS0703]